MESLLGNDAKVNEEEWFQRMLQDFNIDQILFGIKGVAAGYDVEPMYRMFPGDEQTTRYRRQITRDFQRESLRKRMIQFSREMKTARALEQKSGYAASDEQKGKWHCDALHHYFEAIEELGRGLEEEDGLSKAVCGIRDEIKAYCDTEKYHEARQTEQEISQYFAGHSFSLTVQPNRFIVRERIRENVREEIPQEGIPQDKVFTDDKITLVEKAVISFVKKRKPELFHKMKELLDFSMDERFCRLEREAQFYLSFYRYISQFEKAGYFFVMPEESDVLDIQGGIDLALASKMLSSGKKVVANDIRLDEEEKFIVITGPNGGGKTTCARMAGMVLYFSAMGLLVPAQKAGLPFYSRILTHFSVEESEETGKGKLLEELHRLRPIIDSESEKQFVILNELFTTAATRDAEEMGKRVMELLISHQCQGIYVTHIQALARETKRKQTVSMIAVLCEDHRTRSYKIVRRMAEEEEYEDSMIERYHLTQEQIREVLAHVD